MIAPVLRRVVEAEDAFFERKMPGAGKVIVKVDETVEPSDIIAHFEASSGQRLVKLASILKVHGKDVHKYLVKRIGDRIYRDEVIAIRKGMFGLSKKGVVSPADGILDALLPNGSVMIKFLPTPRKLAAAVFGTVKVVTTDSVTIKTQLAKVHGVAGAGVSREGPIRVIAKPEDFVLPGLIDASHQGEILVGGATIARSAIEKAVTLGIKGLVVGGMNYRDFLSMGLDSDVGITILITEGFGVRPMGSDIYNFLKNKQDQFSFISGKEKQVTFPLTEETKTSKKEYISWRDLVVGDRVNTLFQTQEVTLGVVTSIIQTDMFPMVGVKLDSGAEITIPSTNLQIIE